MHFAEKPSRTPTLRRPPHLRLRAERATTRIKPVVIEVQRADADVDFHALVHSATQQPNIVILRAAFFAALRIYAFR
jgi:hypothetical protein